jgi:hypothetical protein
MSELPSRRMWGQRPGQPPSSSIVGWFLTIHFYIRSMACEARKCGRSENLTYIADAKNAKIYTMGRLLTKHV